MTKTDSELEISKKSFARNSFNDVRKPRGRFVVVPIRTLRQRVAVRFTVSIR